MSSLGVLGDEILVNGTHDPHLEIGHERVRLRVLNAANDRIFAFGFDDERAFDQVATDGGLLEQPHRTRRVQLSPGERAELVVALEPGDDVVLRSFAPETGAFLERRVGGADTFDILRIAAEDELEASPPPADELAPIPPLAEPGRSPDRSIDLGDEVIDGRAMDMERIDHIIAAGTTEVWEVTNTDGDPHNLHLHDRHVQVVAVDGRSPPPELTGWHDTVHVPAGSTVQLAIEFGSYVDPTTPYMFHCHVLTHEDAGMRGQFTIVEPDEVDTAPRRIDAPDDYGHH
ncbi:multicopper oxidase family protein [Egibacter rhizosphaerae]|uniref:multicopper oxidase family protein n=1 Tax=Egibacter rhizosphaerae TaxID=1670831 RepID=UPI00197B0530|nr:multicopper oxidase domain-containing protein [Egibacter rhizosphaerae]